MYRWVGVISLFSFYLCSELTENRCASGGPLQGKDTAAEVERMRATVAAQVGNAKEHLIPLFKACMVLEA